MNWTVQHKTEAVTDDSYSPYCRGKKRLVYLQQSPKTVEDLESLTDEELLTYLNDWNEEHRDKDNWLVEINISALAGVFQSLFKDKIVPDGERLSFWMTNRDKIARPVYVAAMAQGHARTRQGKEISTTWTSGSSSVRGSCRIRTRREWKVNPSRETNHATIRTGEARAGPWLILLTHV